MKKILSFLATLSLAQACGTAEPTQSATSNVLEGNGWNIDESPYNLPPGATIGVCNEEGTGVSSFVIDAVRLWLDAGGRDDRIQVSESCSGTRVIHLSKLGENVDFYGRAHPLIGNVHNIDVPPQWAGHWTANHEVGHVFGFAHVFGGVISIMDSEENGKFMNGGYLSAYDLAEIKRTLALPNFKAVNKLWEIPASAMTSARVTALPLPPMTPPAPPSQSSKSCLGANGKTYYKHRVVTTYQGGTYTCDNGRWIRG